MSALQDLQSQVTINTTVEGSALTLIRGLVASLDDAGTDPVALEQVVAQLKTSQAQLASAVAANTIVQAGSPAALAAIAANQAAAGTIPAIAGTPVAVGTVPVPAGGSVPVVETDTVSVTGPSS